MSRGIFNSIRLLRAPSSLTLNVSTDGVSALQRAPVDRSLSCVILIYSMVSLGTGGVEVYSFRCVSEVKICVESTPCQVNEAGE